MMPSINGSRRRHAKQPSSSKKKAPPPDLALTSRYSSSSNNSDTQATPRSIFHSSLRPSKRFSKEPKPVPREEPVGRKAIEGPDKENLDVFAYMQRDDEPWDTPVSDEAEKELEPSDDEISPIPPVKSLEGPQASPRYSDLEVKAIQDGIHRAWGRASLHSDSGISMHSSSPEQESPIMQHKYPMIQEDEADTLDANVEEDEHQHIELHDSPEFLPTNNGPPMHSIEANEGLVPEACHVSPPTFAPQFLSEEPVFPHLELPAISQRRHSNFAPQRRSRRDSPAQLPWKKAGYDLLASNISSHRHHHSRSSSYDGQQSEELIKPIYRKFETLNNRMLLYLQDEISEIEEQLSELDAAIAHEDGGHNKVDAPASRRHEAKLPSQLQWHRLDLLHRSFGKVELYNRALTSYTHLIRTLDPASSTDIAAYRSWIEEHTPIVPSESTFLSHQSDLVAITATPPTINSNANNHTRSRRRHSSTPSCTPSENHLVEDGKIRLDSPFIVLAFMFVATIIVFKVVPRLLARLVISTMVGMATMCLLRPEGMGSWKGWKERRMEVARVAFVMLVLALIVD
ncbi:uncharacterized protein KY384_005699 [Bacidia gigantensis]|uniref:uncharacterized protein n=1 Tax=Bacidia gigantensis TaxID=2732470 RepID=UPI001D036BC8|nr:uncharacterized protein KY384_005699 [Bacidia gigantensis]KAG8529064.1 hypothetical protein KY384_005699 [Bacidia gigantensis]